MIKVENIDVWGFEHTVRGLRSSKVGFGESDSYYEPANFCDHSFIIGDSDLNLMNLLYLSGGSYRSYLDNIKISLDITAPIYWWQWFNECEYTSATNISAYDISRIVNEKEFTLEDFSIENSSASTLYASIIPTIDCLNMLRDLYIVRGDKSDWREIIQILPSSYNQKRTIEITYKTAVSIIEHEKTCELDECTDLAKIFKGLPYMREIIGE